MRFSRTLGFSLLFALCACAPAAPQQKVASPEDRIAVSLRWEFKPEQVPTEIDAPKTHAWLVVTAMGDEQWLDLGSYTGDTFTVPAKAEKLDPPLTSAGIWWAGGGDELVVYPADSGEIVVSHRTIDEEAGFGDLTELARASIPSDSAITVEGGE